MKNKQVRKQGRKIKGRRGEVIRLRGTKEEGAKRKKAEQIVAGGPPAVGLGRAGPVRKTGVDILGDVPWGTHFCQFYQTKENLIEILVPYFKAGLENNEFCMWVTSESLVEHEAKKAMREAIPNFSGYIKRGQIEVVPYSEWYLEKGTFELQRMLKSWFDKLNRCFAEGYAGIRLAGNTGRLGKEDWAGFTEYEAVVNKTIGKYRMLALCTCCLDKCGASEVINVVSDHQFALIRREGEWKFVENTEFKRAEQRLSDYQAKLKSLASKLVQTGEHERRRVAAELHDNISQKLTLAKFILQSLMESMSDSDTLALLDKVRTEIDRIIEDVHSLTFGLSNPVLHELGFETAVKKYLTEEIQQRHGIAFELESYEQFNHLSDDINTCLFRSVRELLINVVKHARAHKIKVSIRQSGGQIHISVGDDGVGFNPAEIASIPTKINGFGLFSIREQLGDLGGGMKITSAPGEGTCVTLSVPLEHKVTL